MTIKKVIEFDDYKAYLAHLEQSRSHITRGFRSRLAEEMGCNNAFVSQVLNTSAHFSLEQALKISRYLRLSELEEHYFLLLIEYARAGTPDLQQHFKKMLSELRDKHLNIKDRVKHQAPLSAEQEALYYSQWHYSTIHMMVTIPGFRTISAIGKALKLSNASVERVVSFLLAAGLLIE